VEADEEYGVWAGVKLPGGQYRKRHQLAHAHLVLRQIAEGLINPRELPESAELLARSEIQPAAEAAVVHVTIGRRPAAA
jgi:WhiB family redox-sensing transcriptional regulator